jgi:predicted membrane protein
MMKVNGGSVKWGIILIIIGFVFLLHNYGVVDFWKLVGILWPILLIWWGYSLIRRARTPHGTQRAARVFGDQTASINSKELNQSTVFGDIRLTVASDEFSGGRVHAVFGDLVIDLHTVERIVGPARLDLETVFGDIVVRLPSHIAVEMNASRAFGRMTAPDGLNFHGNRYRSPDFDTSSERLAINVSQVFGDLEIMRM